MKMENAIDAARGLTLNEALKTGQLHLLSASEMHRLTVEGQLSAEQSVIYSRNRIEENLASGAFVELDQLVLAMAQKIDRLVQQGKGRDLGSLAGVIATIKDTFASIGAKVQYSGTRNPGSHPKKKWKHEQDAHLVHKLRVELEAFIVATTESSNLALDTQVHNVVHPSGKKWATRGSSAGGSIAARELGGIHLISDAAGSGRVPPVLNAGVFGLMLPYLKKLIAGHTPPLVNDPEGVINFGRIAFASQYVEDLIFIGLVLDLIESGVGQNLNHRLLALEDARHLNMDPNSAQAFEEGIRLAEQAGFKVDPVKDQALFGHPFKDLIYLLGVTMGSRIATNVKSEVGGQLKLWAMDHYYSQQAKRRAQGNSGELLEGFQDGLRRSREWLVYTDKLRDHVSRVFEGVLSHGYDGVLMPLDHAGQFTSRETLEPIEGQPYLDVTAGLPGTLNSILNSTALAMPTVELSGLPYGIQIASLGRRGTGRILEVGRRMNAERIQRER